MVPVLCMFHCFLLRLIVTFVSNRLTRVRLGHGVWEWAGAHTGYAGTQQISSAPRPRIGLESGLTPKELAPCGSWGKLQSGSSGGPGVPFSS